MKKKYPARSDRGKKADILSKKMRITPDFKDKRPLMSDDVYQRYSSIMSYYYNAEASGIKDLISAFETVKKAK